MGMPVVVNEIAEGVVWMVKKHNLGVVFSPQDFRGLEKLKEVWENYEEYSRRCREFAEKEMDMRKSVEEYMEIYKLLNPE